MKGTRGSLFFRDVVVVQSLVCSNLLIQLVLKKSAVNQVSIYSLEYLTGEDSKQCTAEAQADKKRYWIISKTDIVLISIDIMLYNGCFSDIELVFTEQIQVFMCCIL